MEKADAKVVYEKGKPEKFTHFELLQKRVDVLEKCLNRIVDILKTNDIHLNQKIEAEFFDDEEVFKRLEE